jgi:hypothetical protein
MNMIVIATATATLWSFDVEWTLSDVDAWIRLAGQRAHVRTATARQATWQSKHSMFDILNDAGNVVQELKARFQEGCHVSIGRSYG